ncbi:MAG: zinc ribbon domain-containing protein [Rhodospirillales bacterium]
MARLEACPTCNKSISGDASVCPKCGEPLAEGWGAVQAGQRRRGYLGGLAVIVILWLAWDYILPLFE